eukprot:m.470998 g.470998  ORF g.470998 m.470998 type:complete len:65 (+) comp20373_c0_seq1:944-1138(+)
MYCERLQADTSKTEKWEPHGASTESRSLATEKRLPRTVCLSITVNAATNDVFAACTDELCVRFV